MTTIQISKTTKQMLEHLKSQEDARSYEEVILHLLEQHKPKSMFGSMKGMTWSKKDRMETHDEKHTR